MKLKIKQEFKTFPASSASVALLAGIMPLVLLEIAS